MTLKIFILGLPRTATTFLYKEVYNYVKQKYSNVIGIFEPFNKEVVDWIFTLGGVVHNTEGKVPHDMHLLPNELKKLIRENSLWMHDWVSHPLPRTPFLGFHYKQILTHLRKIDYFVLKDVILWVKFHELTNEFPDAYFIVSLPDEDTVIEKWREYYSKRPDIFRNPLFKGGVSLFYRYFSMGAYNEDTSFKALELELRRVYNYYSRIVWNTYRYSRNREKIGIVQFRGSLRKEDVLNVLKLLKL